MLYLYQHAGSMPLGEYDLKLSAGQTLEGGKIGVLKTVSGEGGYGETSPTKVVMELAGATDAGPFYVLDDGLAGYATFFGSFGDGTTTTPVFTPWNGGTALGPATYAASGKATGWFQSGIYGTDVYDDSDIDKNSPPAINTALYVNNDGKLTTHNGGGGIVGYFVEFDVITPKAAYPTGTSSDIVVLKFRLA